MGACRVDGRNSAWVKSAEEMFGRFQGELISSLPEWKVRLNPLPKNSAVNKSLAKGPAKAKAANDEND